MIFTSYDKKEIYVREWTKVKDPCGVIQLAHGMNEYTGRYEAFASYFNGLGYIVVGDDHRGHGETDADTLGYTEGEMFSDTVKDMAGIAKFYREKYEGLKYVLFGFSYGSFLTQAFIRKYARFLDGAVIAGSSRQNGAAVRAGKIFAETGKFFKGKDAPAKFVNKTVFGGYNKKFKEGEWLSTNADSNARYHADPYCEFVCSNNFYAEFFKGLGGLYKKRADEGVDTALPILLISGKDDPVGGMGKGVGRLLKYYQGAGVKDVSMHLIEGARHEFLNEEEHREEGLSVIAEFIRRIPIRKK